MIIKIFFYSLIVLILRGVGVLVQDSDIGVQSGNQKTTHPPTHIFVKFWPGESLLVPRKVECKKFPYKPLHRYYNGYYRKIM